MIRVSAHGGGGGCGGKSRGGEGGGGGGGGGGDGVDSTAAPHAAVSAHAWGKCAGMCGHRPPRCSGCPLDPGALSMICAAALDSLCSARCPVAFRWYRHRSSSERVLQYCGPTMHKSRLIPSRSRLQWLSTLL